MIVDMLDEITNGYDGLIEKIDFIAFDSVNIEVSVMRRTDKSWVRVKFKLNELVEFSVKQDRRMNHAVMSYGMAYQCIDSIHYIGLSPYSYNMTSVSDYRMSDIYFAAKKIEYSFNDTPDK